MSSENELYQKIQEVLKHAPENRHSYFQMKYFIIGREPTTQGQMWQCLRELQSRRATIDSLELSIEETRDQLDLLEIDSAKELHNLAKNWLNDYPEELKEREKIIKCRQYARKKRQLESTLEQLESNLKFTWQEAKFFLQMFEAIRRIEPLKEYDDLESQKEYWNERIAQQINLELLLQHPLNTEVVQTALSLHEDAPIRIQTQRTLDHIEGQMKQMKDQYLQKLGAKEYNAETQDQPRQKLSTR